MNDTQAFKPLYIRGNVNLGQVGQNLPGVVVNAINAVSVASTVFPGSSDQNSFTQIQIANKTDVWVHVNFGTLLGGQTVRDAALSDYPVAPGAVVVVSVAPEVNACEVIAHGSPTGVTAVVFTRGNGL